MVNNAGTYRDTMHYINGCDSIRTIINLAILGPVSIVASPVICAGASYTLPWGTVVNTPGTYRDTLRNTTGCDSIRRTVNLSIQAPPLSLRTDKTICKGQNFVLPWGTTVNTQGIYRDTLRSIYDCDSLLRTVSLTVQSPLFINIGATICQGGSYILPGGETVKTAGTYRDTLRYPTGCDSLLRTVVLSVTPVETINRSVSICSDEFYTLPSGQLVNSANIYIDTVRTASGCDSIVHKTDLKIKPVPVITLSKSNDIDCVLGTAKLAASGGNTYRWNPASTLNNAEIGNPVASPVATTLYTVTATANGCTSKASITVKVSNGNLPGAYQVASAFSPNNDGLNDCFGVPHWGNVTNFSFSIYNRYGQEIFKTDNPFNCWDGTFKGVEQGTGAYVYLISARGICGILTHKKGTVMLVR